MVMQADDGQPSRRFHIAPTVSRARKPARDVVVSRADDAISSPLVPGRTRDLRFIRRTRLESEYDESLWTLQQLRQACQEALMGDSQSRGETFKVYTDELHHLSTAYNRARRVRAHDVHADDVHPGEE